MRQIFLACSVLLVCALTAAAGPPEVKGDVKTDVSCLVADDAAHLNSVVADTEADTQEQLAQVGNVETTGFEVPDWDARQSGQTNFFCGSSYFGTCTAAPIATSCTGNPVADKNCCSAHPNPLNGWFAPDDSQHCREPHIDIIHPASGAQHLRFDRDPFGGDPPGCTGLGNNNTSPTKCRVTAFTPDMGPQITGPTTISWDLSSDTPFGESLKFFTVGSNGSDVGTTMYFYAAGIIYILDRGSSAYVVAGPWFYDGLYFQVRIEKDPCAGTLKYFYNNALIYSTPLDETPTIRRAILETDNGPGRFDIDNYSVGRGPPCPCSVVRPSGSVVAWGLNTSGQTNVPAPNTDFTAIAAGSGHSLGLKADGSIVAWGSNSDGQLNVPAPNTSFTAVAAGATHSLGLKCDGSIVAWGRNNEGQCNVPGPFPEFVAVAAGKFQSLGLLGNGFVVAWGCGGGTGQGSCNVPAPDSGFIAIAAGYQHSLGLKADGSIVGWGLNTSGELNVPAPNTGLIAVAAGFNASLGLKTNGSIVGWGTNAHGELDVPAPNSDFVAVAIGGGLSVGHSLGLKSDGSVVGWGTNTSGETNIPAPNTGFTAIAAGQNHSLGLKAVALAPGAVVPDPAGIDKVRYISFQIPSGQTGQTSLQVKLVSLMHPNPANLPQFPAPDFHLQENTVRYVGAPGNCQETESPPTNFKCATLQCTPVYMDWEAALGSQTLHVTGQAVVPSSTYEVRQLGLSCQGNELSCAAISSPLTIKTQRWGDVASAFQTPSPAPLTQPNISDVSACVDKFKSVPAAAIVARADVNPAVPNERVDIADVANIVDAFKNLAYPFPGPTACP